MNSIDALRRVIREATQPPVDVAALSNEQILELMTALAAERKLRASRKKRDSVETPRHAMDLIKKAAWGEMQWDDDVMDSAFEILRSVVPKKAATIDAIEDLAGSLSNAAYELEMGNYDYDEAEDAEADLERGLKKLEKLLASLGAQW